MKKILLTGAGGYIGSVMTEILLDRGDEVIAFDRYFFGDIFKDIKERKDLHIVKGDIRYIEKDIVKDVDTVIDLASISNDPSSELLPKITYEINHIGAVHLAKIAKDAGVKKFIFSSSCSVYGHGEGILTEQSPCYPVSTYASSKLKAEKDILKLGDDNFSVTIMRNATVYGLSKRRMRFDLIINIMTFCAWDKNKIFIMGGGRQWRPLIHIEDISSAFIKVLDEKDIKKINKQIFNIGSNEQNYRVFQIANYFKKYFFNILIENIPDDPDPRSYHINFDKFTQTMNFSCKKTIDDGIVEIKEALEKGLIEKSIKTNTVEFYKYLLEADEILSQVKIGGRLF